MGTIASMQMERRVGFGAIGIVCLTAVLVSGCSDRSAASVPVVAPAQAAEASQSQAGDASQPAFHFSSNRCQRFAQSFDELAACLRADGTLQSFSDRDIRWRVRYFVRYWRMPCNEAPTIEEGYVYHMVTRDLYKDSDLNDRQRTAIRVAMFDGKVNCR